jgi:hypothetical protein
MGDPMSALTNSGRSEGLKLPKSNGGVRPEAADHP